VRGHITLDYQNDPWESKYCDSDEMTIILTAIIIIIIGSSCSAASERKNIV
jgi:hypothetical protein